MCRRFLLLITLLPLLVMVLPTQAQQTSVLDGLPNCNFTGAAPDDNVLIGAVVYNLQTGQGCAENLDTMFPIASVPKIMIAAALYETILESNGVITFETPLTFTERYWMAGSTDCLDASSLNQQVGLGELSDIMIACSDNAATWMIMDALGWETVDAYVASLGIEGIGPVIPYAEVDRQKLIFLDETWRQVPTAMASRFYRREGTTGLNTYFADIPQYSRDERVEANALYFDNTDFNSATPRAVGEYMLKLANDAPQDTIDGQVARWLFGAMLLTQRQYTSQAFPGTVSVGAKNGFDTGLRAEVNVMFDNLPEQQRNPTAFSIVFARQLDLDVPNLQPPRNDDDGVINRYMLTLSPIISRKLYPNYSKPTVAFSPRVSSVTVKPKFVMDTCWRPYADAGFLLVNRGELENCWLSRAQSFFVPEDSIGVGVVLQNLNDEDTRITFVFTAPDGEQRSYQTQRFFQESAAIYWWHPIQQQTGEWMVDVFLNRVLVHTQAVTVESF